MDSESGALLVNTLSIIRASSDYENEGWIEREVFEQSYRSIRPNSCRDFGATGDPARTEGLGVNKP